MTNVLFLSPGYPPEMPQFVAGLGTVGARVMGIGDQPRTALHPQAQKHLTDYLQVHDLWNEAQTVSVVKHWAQAVRIDRVECLWEPGMYLAARIREALGVPGMTVADTVPFRDKEVMKQRLDAVGIRTPRHDRAKTAAEVRAAAERIGYPLIVKPIAGAGSADTHRVDDAKQLEEAIRATSHVPEVSVEEFIDGEEFTFDTVCAGGKILYWNVSWYRPRPLVQRQLQWVSPQTIALRDPEQKDLAGGVEMGRKVLQALNFRDGFTHMEWYRKADGEAVFGEIGGRAPGARSTDIMNWACDFDVWQAWAEATIHGRIGQRWERRYNAGNIFKRAHGEGRIQRIEGLERIQREFGEHIVDVALLPVGAQRRNWKQTLISDGCIVVRHPHLGTLTEILDRIGTDVQMYAG
ncbi:MAG: ATP-grasp domain-containing protein [Planctomycetes bacterium]|nr:ATP-grasp domain-containing protein [Planctomycetota bacterium]